MLANSVAFMVYFTTYRDNFFFAVYVIFFKTFHIFGSVLFFFFFSNICPSILENKIENVNQF